MARAREKTIDYESLLKHIGQFGSWQRRIFFWMCLVSGASGLFVVVYVFTGFEPRYRCHVSYCENSTDAVYGAKSDNGYDFPDYVSAGIPPAAIEKSSLCQFYDIAKDVSVEIICFIGFQNRNLLTW